jgi:predicted nucleic acid-binding protein
MSGKRYILDTNAIVALLQGEPAIVQLLQGVEMPTDFKWIGQIWDSVASG